jgi:hypothetical protein
MQTHPGFGLSEGSRRLFAAPDFRALVRRTLIRARKNAI